MTTKMNSKEQPLFTPVPNCPEGSVVISPAGILILMAGCAYDIHEEPTAKKTGKAMMTQILNAARAGGYTQCDILQTILAKGEVSPRVKEMAVEACNAAGIQSIGEILDQARKSITK